jgi:hypothetical protein
VSLLLLLDAGPLSLVTKPRESDLARRCNRWLGAMLAREVRVVVPAIADYELRRELLRADRLEGLSRLDDLGDPWDTWKSTRTCSGMPPRSGPGPGPRGYPPRTTRRSTAT